ncbi:hypothetical protein L2E82_40987 [Cichorium intybus]|uniref:Uncharacterized protein n=1 Tax=Cichorium intybus TaxID=13427 RepID=A0ACB9ALN1_CICIN|nr:hypothetical protein L2E82_40987 [Cichorium intybus]
MQISYFTSKKGTSKISCSIKEKESIAENERISPIVTGLVDDELGEKPGNGLEKLGFENLNWPPWKNVPADARLLNGDPFAERIVTVERRRLMIANLKKRKNLPSLECINGDGKTKKEITNVT